MKKISVQCCEQSTRVTETSKSSLGEVNRQSGLQATSRLQSHLNHSIVLQLELWATAARLITA